MIDFDSFRWVIELILGVLATVMWYLLRKIISDVGELGKALDNYKLYVSERFVTQGSLSKAIDNFSSGIGEVFRKLERIEDKLDLKADK
jgi:hypothetical protein